MRRPSGYDRFGQCQISEMQTGAGNIKTVWHRAVVFAAVFAKSESDRKALEVRKEKMFVLYLLSRF